MKLKYKFKIDMEVTQDMLKVDYNEFKNMGKDNVIQKMKAEVMEWIKDEIDEDMIFNNLDIQIEEIE